MKTRIKDQKYLGRDLPADLEIVGSTGNFLIGSDGKKYLDFVMGWCVGNLGWGIKDAFAAIKSFKGPAYVSPGYLYRPWAELAELLAEITPGKLKKSFRATGGTEAVEIAMQAAMSHTKRQEFISIERSYHGHSIGALSIGDSGFRRWYKNLLPGCHKIKPPLGIRAAKLVEKILSKGKAAAFVTEPIICNLGVEIPDRGFFDIVTNACRKSGTLFIADEVATGFGRTGKMFASEHYGLEPDIICLGKGLTGGYGGLGAAVMTDEVAKSMEFDFSFYSTFGWNPLNVEAALAYLKYFVREKDKILGNVSEISGYFEKRLREMSFRYPAEFRIRGLAICAKFGNIGYASEITRKCRSNGLLISGGTRSFSLFPALTIDKKTAKKGLDILEESL
jgi:acetylornithine/succinyldiaminopimelate/putrescine aminotransferase